MGFVDSRGSTNVMKRIYFYKGLPASGKTMAAKAFVDKHFNTVKRVSKDDLRAMLDNGRWSKDAESFVILARNALVTLALDRGKSVIIDDTNLHPKHRLAMDNIAGNQPVLTEVEEVDFTDVDVEECIKRDQKRINYVGEKVIRKMYNQFLAPKVEKVEYNPELSSAIIVDLDGTLCLHNGRSPYATELCDRDLLNTAIYNLIVNQVEQGHYLILVSGREDKYRDLTEQWLGRYRIPWGFLYMRPTGDKRRDDIIKKEIFDREIRNKYNVLFVLDDRDRVVRLWRSLGLTCLQVAEGSF